MARGQGRNRRIAPKPVVPRAVGLNEMKGKLLSLSDDPKTFRLLVDGGFNVEFTYDPKTSVVNGGGFKNPTRTNGVDFEARVSAKPTQWLTAGAGFYSYTLGNWHIVSLNSNVGVSNGSDQYVWLLDDLEANKRSATAKCTLAYWHHPLFTSGPSAGTNALMRDIWSLLYQYGVDVVINGHDHLYERFAPQDVNGRRDAFGIQEFVAGTGGAPLYDFGPTASNSQFKMKAYGVLRLTLRDVGYDSVFIEAGTGAQFDMNLNVLCH